MNKYGSDLNVRSTANTEWAFLACSGAAIDNVRAEADGGSVQPGDKGYREIHTQLSYPWVDYGTDVVTITIGGNDAASRESSTVARKDLATRRHTSVSSTRLLMASGRSWSG